MGKKETGFEIKAEQRQSWTSIAAIWAGGMICVPCLMIGGVLAGGGLSIGQMLLSILIGYGLICAYMIMIGMQACDTGLPVAVMASGALGTKRFKIYHQYHSRHSMYRLVWYSVRNMRQRFCIYDRRNER